MYEDMVHSFRTLHCPAITRVGGLPRHCCQSARSEWSVSTLCSSRGHPALPPEMTDVTSLLPICMWTAAGLLVGPAIYHAWNTHRGQRQEETGYEKIQKGETINGWKVAISLARIQEKHKRGDGGFVFPSWRRSDSEPQPEFARSLSLVIWFKHEMPDGRIVYFLSRYSLISPHVDETICRVVYSRSRWYCQLSCYLTSRVVAVVFQSNCNRKIFRLLLVDVFRKRHRSLSIVSPINYPEILVVRQGATINRLSVVLTAVAPLPNNMDDWNGPKRVFCDATYEIPDSGSSMNDVLVKAISWEELVVPMVNGEGFWAIGFWSRPCTYPMIAVTYESESPENIGEHRVVSFDRPGTWRITPLDQWLESLRETPFGAKFLNALDAFRSLSLPTSWDYLCDIPPLRHLTFVSSCDIAGALFSTTFFGGILQCWLYPPSAKYLAAEALYRANPELTAADAKKLIGFDIFDGMLDDKSGDTAQIIFL